MAARPNSLAQLVGRRIRQLRLDRGWDQVDLEAHLDGSVKRATISDFETGRRLPSLRTLQAMANAFEVEPATLLLDPGGQLGHRVAVASLTCSESTLRHVAKLLDLG